MIIVRKLFVAWGAILIVISTVVPCSSNAAIVWKRVNQGGGGYIVGMAIRAGAPGYNPTVYVRADVGGAYRFDFSTSQWIPLFTETSLPSSAKTNFSYECDGIAIDPGDSNVVYAAPGGTGMGPSGSHLLKSTDRGATFTELSLPGGIFEGNNGQGRMRGERIAVDPADSRVVYVGTRTTGLYVSIDGGASFAKVAAIPSGSEILGGVCGIVFDPLAGAIDGKTKRIYVNVGGAPGIYQSNDCGSTWNRIKGDDANGYGFEHIKVAGGALWMNFHDDNQLSGGVCKYDGTAWVAVGAFPEAPDICGLTIKQGNPNVVFAASNGIKRIYRSTNGGTSWVQTDFDPDWPADNYAKTIQGPPWQSGTKPWVEMCNMEFDPNHPNTIWICGGNGVWKGTDFSDTVTLPHIAHHANWSSGIEELCTTDILATTGGKLIFGTMDYAGFVVTNLDSCPTKRIGLIEAFGRGEMSHTSDLNYAPGDRNLVVASIGNNLGSGSNMLCGYSKDGGATWTAFKSQPSNVAGSIPYGDITLCGDDVSRIVYAPISGAVYYTNDTGVTWHKSAISGTYAPNNSMWNMSMKCLAADGANGNVYLYSMNGSFFVSTDSGKTFTKVCTTLPESIWIGQFKTVPGVANDIWCATGPPGGGPLGVYHSTDGGAHWTYLAKFNAADAIALGKPLSGTYPALYVAGKAGGAYGIYRSDDKGVNWTLISGYPCGIVGAVCNLEADKNVYCKLYASLGGGGCGFAYGQDNEIAIKQAADAPHAVKRQERYSLKMRLGGALGRRPDKRGQKAYDFHGRLVKPFAQGALIVEEVLQ